MPEAFPINSMTFDEAMAQGSVVKGLGFAGVGFRGLGVQGFWGLGV